MPKYIDAEALKAAVSAYCDKTKPCSTISVMGLIPDVVILRAGHHRRSPYR